MLRIIYNQWGEDCFKDDDGGGGGGGGGNGGSCYNNVFSIFSSFLFKG